MSNALKVPKWLYDDELSEINPEFIVGKNNRKYYLYRHKKGNGSNRSARHKSPRFCWAIAEKTGKDIINSFKIPANVRDLVLLSCGKDREKLLIDSYHCSRLGRDWETVFPDYNKYVPGTAPVIKKRPSKKRVVVKDVAMRTKYGSLEDLRKNAETQMKSPKSHKSKSGYSDMHPFILYGYNISVCSGGKCSNK